MIQPKHVLDDYAEAYPNSEKIYVGKPARYSGGYARNSTLSNQKADGSVKKCQYSI